MVWAGVPPRPSHARCQTSCNRQKAQLQANTMAGPSAKRLVYGHGYTALRDAPPQYAGREVKSHINLSV